MVVNAWWVGGREGERVGERESPKRNRDGVLKKIIAVAVWSVDQGHYHNRLHKSK